MQTENNKEPRHIVLKNRRGDSMIGVHKDHAVKYQRSLWDYEESLINYKVFSKHIKVESSKRGTVDGSRVGIEDTLSGIGGSGLRPSK